MANGHLHGWIVELKRFELIGDAVVVSDDPSVFSVQRRRVPVLAYVFLVITCGDIFVAIWPRQGGEMCVVHWNSIIRPRQLA